MAEPTKSLATASRFWRRLADEHTRELERFGLDNFKRHQALRYFTWQWRLAAAYRSQQLRFLLRNTNPSALRRCLTAAPIDLRDDVWAGVPWSRPDRWFYIVATRLLWTFAETRDVLGVLDLAEPEMGNPLPVYWNDRLISQDLGNTAIEVGTVAQALSGKLPQSVLEIGAGYGRTAYALLHLFPECRYTIVDIEPAITISRDYLTTLFPDRDVRFILPGQVNDLAEGSVDLAISISSLQEMTWRQVGEYLRLIDRVVAQGHVYLKQWDSWFNPSDAITIKFDEYPVPDRWRLLLKRPASVQTNFVEAVWEVPVAQA